MKMEEDDDVEMSEEETKSKEKPKKVFVPGNHKLKENQELECDETAYVMFHQASTVAPCLSFDVACDDLGETRTEFPYSMWLIAGTQAEQSRINNLIVMKVSNLHKMKQKAPKEMDSEDSDESESESEDEEDELPLLSAALLKHEGCVNRLRVNSSLKHPLAATWSESGSVHIWNLKRPLEATESEEQLKKFNSGRDIEPLFTFDGHKVEGFALDWSRTQEGYLLSGDCNKNIHLWTPSEGSSWNVDTRPFVGHRASVEDLQWSPTESSVFASCSVDRSIRIWDIRVPPSKACMLSKEEAHSRDVNVISWNRNEPFIISGGDDGVIKIWDLREFKDGNSVATFKHHMAPITSVEWHPTDSTVFAASGSDDQLTIWDLAVERDEETTNEESEETLKLPPQLLFIHQGQKDIKELHWHPQIPGVIISTASSGFNVFKTISV